MKCRLHFIASFPQDFLSSSRDLKWWPSNISPSYSSNATSKYCYWCHWLISSFSHGCWWCLTGLFQQMVFGWGKKKKNQNAAPEKWCEIKLLVLQWFSKFFLSRVCWLCMYMSVGTCQPAFNFRSKAMPSHSWLVPHNFQFLPNFSFCPQRDSANVTVCHSSFKELFRMHEYY